MVSFVRSVQRAPASPGSLVSQGVAIVSFTGIGYNNSIIGVLNGDRVNETVTCVDNVGPPNVYTVLTSPQFDSTSNYQFLFYGVNIKGNPTQLSFSGLNGGTIVVSCDFDEFTQVSGVTQALIAWNPSVAANISEGVTPTINGCTVWGYCNSSATSPAQTPGTGFFLGFVDSVTGAISEYLSQAIAASVTVGFVQNIGDTGNGSIMAAAVLTPAQGDLLVLV